MKAGRRSHERPIRSAGQRRDSRNAGCRRGLAGPALDSAPHSERCHSVRDLVELAFGHVGLDWRKYVTLDPKLIRPAEVEHLVGDSSKARAQLGWAQTIDFAGLVRMMVDADMERVAAAPQLATSS